MQISTKSLFALGVVIALAIPPTVFLAVALQAGLTPGETLSALAEQYRASRQNLLIVGLPGLFPIALLAAVCWLVGRFVPRAPPRSALAFGGLLPILAVSLWAHLKFWPLFLPARTYPGFPHGLELIIGPLIFAPILMLGGLLVAGLVTRLATASADDHR